MTTQSDRFPEFQLQKSVGSDNTRLHDMTRPPAGHAGVTEIANQNCIYGNHYSVTHVSYIFCILNVKWIGKNG